MPAVPSTDQESSVVSFTCLSPIFFLLLNINPTNWGKNEIYSFRSCIFLPFSSLFYFILFLFLFLSFIFLFLFNKYSKLNEQSNKTKFGKKNFSFSLSLLFFYFIFFYFFFFLVPILSSSLSLFSFYFLFVAGLVFGWTISFRLGPHKKQPAYSSILLFRPKLLKNSFSLFIFVSSISYMFPSWTEAWDRIWSTHAELQVRRPSFYLRRNHSALLGFHGRCDSGSMALESRADRGRLGLHGCL